MLGRWRMASSPGGECLSCPMWSFWTAFERGFDENQLKCAQTRAIWTSIRSITVAFDHNKLEFLGLFAIFDPPPPTPPIFMKVDSALEIPLFLTL
jgi:hypothetical protein